MFNTVSLEIAKTSNGYRMLDGSEIPMPDDKAARIDWTFSTRTFYRNADGDAVRVWFLPRGYTLPDDIKRAALYNKRAVCKYELLEDLGAGIVRNLIEGGYVVPAKGLGGAMWVTRKARTEFDLPFPKVGDYRCGLHNAFPTITRAGETVFGA